MDFLFHKVEKVKDKSGDSFVILITGGKVNRYMSCIDGQVWHTKSQGKAQRIASDLNREQVKKLNL